LMSLISVGWTGFHVVLPIITSVSIVRHAGIKSNREWLFYITPSRKQRTPARETALLPLPRLKLWRVRPIHLHLFLHTTPPRTIT
jgi:hypothetical protein